MGAWLLLPPVLFSIVFIIAWIEYKGMAIFQSGELWPSAPGKLKSYACGEDYKNHRVRPEYRQFFPFAFFFTIMHVVALMVATVPSGSTSVLPLAITYLVGAAIGLFILFRS